MYDGWSDAPMSAHERSTIILENVEYWHTEKAHFWSIDEGIMKTLVEFEFSVDLFIQKLYWFYFWGYPKIWVL